MLLAILSLLCLIRRVEGGHAANVPTVTTTTIPPILDSMGRPKFYLGVCGCFK